MEQQSELIEGSFGDLWVGNDPTQRSSKLPSINYLPEFMMYWDISERILLIYG